MMMGIWRGANGLRLVFWGWGGFGRIFLFLPVFDGFNYERFTY